MIAGLLMKALIVKAAKALIIFAARKLVKSTETKFDDQALEVILKALDVD
jgi:hypothetical protein